MDKIARSMRTTQADFVTDYFNERVILDLGMNHHPIKLEGDYTVGPNSVLTIVINTFVMLGSYTITLTNAATSVVLSIGFGPDGNTIVTPLTVETGFTLLNTAAELGFDGVNTFLNVKNETGSAGSFHLVVKS
jgi:hypothetical protein